MTRQSFVCIVVGLVCTMPLAASEKGNQPPEGFAALFNGKDFTNWKVPEGDNGHWKIIDGVIDYDARSEAPGDKSLWTKKSFSNFTLMADWRLKKTDFVHRRVAYILPDGSHAHMPDGNDMWLTVQGGDSGIYLRGNVKSQVNIWCFPIGSGEVYGYRVDPKQPAHIKTGVTPRTQADRAVGKWNRFVITIIGDRLTVILNNKKVISNAQLPGVPTTGPIALQHHGKLQDGKWVSPPSMVQFKNIYIKELP